VVYTKVDKLSATERGLLKERSRKSFGRRAPILVSSESGEGLVTLWSAIFEAVSVVATPAGAPDAAANDKVP